MGRDDRVTPVDPLLADPSDQPLDRLGRDVEIGQRRQIARRLLRGDAVEPGLGALLLLRSPRLTLVSASR
jgi:hypothetical protein